MKRICFFVILVLWAVSCIQPKVQNSAGNNLLTSDTIRYAQGFTVHHFDGYTAVEVRDPWDSTRLLQRYLLVDRDQLLACASDMRRMDERMQNMRRLLDKQHRENTE